MKFPGRFPAHDFAAAPFGLRTSRLILVKCFHARRWRRPVERGILRPRSYLGTPRGDPAKFQKLFRRRLPWGAKSGPQNCVFLFSGIIEVSGARGSILLEKLVWMLSISPLSLETVVLFSPKLFENLVFRARSQREQIQEIHRGSRNPP